MKMTNGDGRTLVVRPLSLAGILEERMSTNTTLVSTIYEGWLTYQATLIKALTPLTSEQLTQRVAPELRSVGEIAAHMVAVRARWFYLLMDEGGDTFEILGGWDRRDAPARSAAELVSGLEATWSGMHEAIARWSESEWAMTWPGEDDSEPELLTRPWVIWHLIEHDLHHGGEISIILGAHGVRALEL
jgi:uncharacterized damage-inducible protein DinB